MSTVYEEQVVWNEVFYAETFDFRSRVNFRRYDECTFVKCTLLMDASTEQIAFTGCTFKDCNIGSIDSDEARGIVSKDNTFERPLDDQRKDFEERLVNRRSNIAGRMTIAAYCGSATSAKVNGRVTCPRTQRGRSADPFYFPRVP